jgi:hypothetical protein
MSSPLLPDYERNDNTELWEATDKYVLSGTCTVSVFTVNLMHSRIGDAPPDLKLRYERGAEDENCRLDNCVSSDIRERMFRARYRGRLAGGAPAATVAGTRR